MIAIVDCVNEGVAAGAGAVARGVGEPGWMMGVEVAEDDGVSFGVAKDVVEGEVAEGVALWAAAGWWDVDVVDGDL